jgi:hypothetical protein
VKRATFQLISFLFVVEAAVSLPAMAANPWTVSTSTSSGITTTSLQNASADDASLIIYCTSAGTWGLYLRTTYATANGAVRYRIGPGDVISETWSEASPSANQTLTPPSVSLALVRQIYQNWDLVFQYNAAVFGSRTAQVNASGLSEALAQTRDAFRWPTDLLPPDKGWGKPLPAQPPVGAQVASYAPFASNQFPPIAWRAHNAQGKPQLLVRLGDSGGPCIGPVPITDHRLYVTQGAKVVSAVSGTNFEVDCLRSPTIVALSGDFDPGKAFSLNSYAVHSSANFPGLPIATVLFDDQIADVLTLVEYYHAGFDHYFITWVPAEIAILDEGVTIKGWTRTGRTLPTYIMALNATSPVCRMYIPPESGDSHFFGRGMEECNTTAQRNPSFILEDPKFMQMYMPTQGVCPPNTIEVYRVFSNRRDANHRYMIDKALRDAMVAQGWRAEGDGPNIVAMCAPI